jgi:uncharacterized protein YjbJ (UPF0337 family)
MMNEDILKGQWNQIKGQVRQRWGKLTDDDVAQIKGSRDVLLGKIQEHYGRTRQEAEEDLKRWADAQQVG